MRIAGILALVVCLAVLDAAPVFGQVIAPEFAGSYELKDLGAPADVPAPFGGLTLEAGTTGRLLIGGSANTEQGALYEVGVVRDGQGHITGFDGAATRFADAAYNDGGITYGPDGVLFLARWPLNELGQTRPGSTVTDKIIPLAQFEVAPSLASLQFVPAGQPGAGRLKLASYQGGQWYDADVEPDGNGTFGLAHVTAVPDSTLPGGPEGFVYVGTGSPRFDGPSMLVAEWDAGQVAAYQVDANGDPIVSSRRTFITGLDGAEGSFIDPVTGDFLFSTFGGSDQVIVVRGFAPPVSLAVQTSVTSDNGGILSPGDFTVHVKRDGADVVGSPQQGSAGGAFFAVDPGVTYTVSVDEAPGYATSIGGACAADGTVSVQEGVQPICTIAADDQPTATLTVTKRVEGGRWLPEDFTVRVQRAGIDVGGSPAPGGEATVYQLVAGSYTVSEDAARGYVAAFSDVCQGGTVTLADGDAKTCTLTNRDAPVASGLVIESYGPSRTDGQYGLTESNLKDTREYLRDPANFGPSGIVAGAVEIAPGIRTASARVLDGVDVLFTGWVPSSSYTPAEKAALREFVVRGGTLIATTDDEEHSMADAFGLEQADGSGNPTVNTITDQGHPIAAGPFGAVTTFNQYAFTGHYESLGPDAHEVGANAQGTSLAVIERGKLEQGSGGAIFVADVDVFTNAEFGGAAYNATLIKNIFAFATGQTAQPVLRVSDVSESEGDAGTKMFTFIVGIDAPAVDAVRVHYATADVDATAGSDYTAAAGDLELAPGQTSKSVSIAVHGDTAVEADERFRVALSSPSGARIADPQGIGTVRNDDANLSPPQQPPPQDEELRPPQAGETVNALPAKGTVKVKLKGTNRFVELEEGQQIPVGSVIDTLNGRVTIVAAGGQSADFFDGIFRLTQGKGAKPLTTLTLVEALRCPKAGKAMAAARKKKKRRLWGDGSGNFRTKGKHSAATVVGTRWLVEDRCESTLTKVTRGKVRVRDFVKRKDVVVRAGKQYVARAKG